MQIVSTFDLIGIHSTEKHRHGGQPSTYRRLESLTCPDPLHQSRKAPQQTFQIRGLLDRTPYFHGKHKNLVDSNHHKKRQHHVYLPAKDQNHRIQPQTMEQRHLWRHFSSQKIT